MAIESKQKGVTHRHQTAKHNQFFAIALLVRALCQPKADQDPGNGVNGIKQSNPKRLRPHLATQKQAQRWGLQSTGNTDHKRDDHKSDEDTVKATSHRD